MMRAPLPWMPLRPLTCALLPILVTAACRPPSRPPAVSLDVALAARLSPASTRAGEPVAVTYRWEVGPGVPRLDHPHQAFVHFLAADGAVLLSDDHAPQPPPSSWEPGAVYEYTRVVFTHHQFPGPLQIRAGLYDLTTGARVGQRGPDAGQTSYRIGALDVTRHAPSRQTLFFSGFQSPWSTNDAPFDAYRWMGREAVVACRNPRTDAVLFVRGSAPVRSFASPPRLRLSLVGGVREYEIADDDPFTL